METYRKIFKLADHSTISKILAEEPDFPYDDEIVEIMSKRTDLEDADELLEVFAKKKEDIAEQNGIMDFVLTVDRDDDKQATNCYMEYFKKYNGFYVRRRYCLFDINKRMRASSTLPPSKQLERCLEEATPQYTKYSKISDYAAATPNDAEVEQLLSGQFMQEKGWVDKAVKAAASKTFYYYSSSCSCTQYLHPYTQQDIQNNFTNRSVSRRSGYEKMVYIFTDNVYSSIDTSVKDYLVNKYDCTIQLTFYMHRLLTQKLVSK